MSKNVRELRLVLCRCLLKMAAIGCVGVLDAATVDLTDRLEDGATSYTVTEVSSEDGYSYNGETAVDLIFDLASEASYTGSVSIAGNIRVVKRGTGTLSLTAANTYTGGTRIEQGVLGITVPDALGAGDVEIVASSDDSKPSRLRFEAGMTFANNIKVSGGWSKTGSDAPGSKLAARSSISLGKNTNTTLTGDITATCDLYIWDDSSGSKTRTFSGKVSVAGNHIVAAPYNSTYVFSGGVEAEVFHATYVYVHMGSVRFKTTPCDIGRLRMAYTKVEVYDDVLGEDTWVSQDGSSDPVRTIFYLCGDVTVGKWTTAGGDNSGKLMRPLRSSPSAAAYDFTVKASENATSYGTLRDNVTLVYDPVSTVCTQTLTAVTTQRNHDTKGAMIVKGGTLKVTGINSFPNLTAIKVEDDAAFIADTTGTQAFVGLTNISVGANGVFFCAGSTVAPFSPNQTKVEISSTSMITLPLGETFSVTELWCDGIRLRGGTYTPDGANGTKPLAQLTQGAIYVPDFAGEGVSSVWTGASGEDIGVAANWEGGNLPDWSSGGAELTFAAEGCGSTRAVFTESVDVKSIIFRQPLGFTLGVQGSASVKLLGGITFGDIGTAVPNYTVDVPLNIVGDQTWTLPDNPEGVVTFTKPFLSDADAGGETLYITNNVGTLNFHMTNSTYLGSIYAQANTMNISGENVFGSSGRGGTVTLKLNHNNQTAKCNFRGATINQDLKCDIVDKNNYYVFECVSGSTNVFRGYTQLPQWTYFGKNSYTVFENGAMIDGYNRQYIAENAVVVFRGDLLDYHDDGGKHGMSPVSPNGTVGARMVFECPVGIEEAERVDISEAVILDMRYPYAFSAGKWEMDGTMLLNGYSQKATRFQSSYGTVSSTNLPAFVELNLPVGGNETNTLKFIELAGFRMIGAGFVRMDGISTSSGSFVVENGTVEMGEATWLNATNVTVGGTGRLKLTKSKTFASRKAALMLAGEGVIDVPAGVSQGFWGGAVLVDGEWKKIPVGSYNAQSQGLMAGRIEGEGSITVRGPTFFITVR